MIEGLKIEELIYVADNNRLYRDIIKIALEQEGYAVRLFDDGSHALKALSINKAIQINNPTLIICELEMRVMDGLTLFEEVRRLPSHHSSIPFLFMTFSTNFELIAKAEERSRCRVFDKATLLEPMKHLINEVFAKPVTTYKKGENELQANSFII